MFHVPAGTDSLNAPVVFDSWGINTVEPVTEEIRTKAVVRAASGPTMPAIQPWFVRVTFTRWVESGVPPMFRILGGCWPVPVAVRLWTPPGTPALNWPTALTETEAPSMRSTSPETAGTTVPLIHPPVKVNVTVFTWFASTLMGFDGLWLLTNPARDAETLCSPNGTVTETAPLLRIAGRPSTRTVALLISLVYAPNPSLAATETLMVPLSRTRVKFCQVIPAALVATSLWIDW